MKNAVTLWDSVQPKLGLRITPAGAKSFIHLVSSGKRKVLGRYPELSLKDARATLARTLAQKTLGLIQPALTVRIGLREAVNLYIEKHCQRISKPGSAYPYETRLLLEGRLVAPMRGQSVSKISKSDITDVLDWMGSTPSQAMHTFTAMKAFFKWCIGRGYIETNPCDGIPAPPRPESRERVLSAAELKKVMLTAVEVGYPFGTVVQLLVLLAQRRGEISALRREWIDTKEKTISFPATATKNRRLHVVPYGDMTAALFDTIPNKEGFLFPAQRQRRKGKPATTMSGWSKQKAAFDAIASIDPWTLHDLRRTASTIWAEIGIAQNINDALLNHVSGGTHSPVARIYNRYQYLAEKRSALQVWEERLAKIISYPEEETSGDASRIL